MHKMGAGDYHKATFDKDELAALGEVAETAPAAEKAEPEKKEEPESEAKETGAPETKETEVTESPVTEAKTEPTKEETAAIEKKGARFEDGYVIDEDGERIPLKRFREVYREAKEGERTKERLDLLKKLGPEKFYEVYPAEKPEGWTPPQEKTVDPLDMQAQYDNPTHPYHGLTLREIMKQDPDEARRLYEGLQKQRTETATKAKQKTAQEIAENTREAAEFAAIVAAEKFGKADVNTLTDSEIEQVKDLIKETYAWGMQNGRSGYRLADMHTLRQRIEAATSKAKQEKAVKALEAENKPAVKSIGNGGGSAGLSGFEAYEAMSEDALTDAIDTMKDKQLRKFLKDAPKSLRKKYPNIPWD